MQLSYCLLSKDFLEFFMVTIKKKQSCFIMDESQFSEIFNTEEVKKTLDFLSKILKKEIE